MSAARLVLGAYLALLIGLGMAGDARADFAYRRNLTIDRSLVGASGTANGTLANYPLLVSIQSDELRAQAHGGHVVSEQGHDIVFRALDAVTCGGEAVCTLDHELEKYDATTGQVVAWVRVPAVNTNAASADTVLYIYYGNASVSGSTELAQAVWGSSYEAVWHMEQDPSGSAPQVLDSTSNARHGTSGGAMTSSDLVSCRVERCLEFDDVDDYVNTGNYMSGLSAVSAEAWVYKTDTGDDRVVAKALGTTPDKEYIFSLGVSNTSRLRVRLATGGTSASTFTGLTQVTLNTWHHLALSWDGSTVRLFLDGELDGTGTKTGTMSSNAQPVLIANNDLQPSDRYWAGSLDEIRLANTALSADYFKTSYNNHLAPSTFHALGSEESAPQFSVGFSGAEVARDLDGRTRVRWQVQSETDNLGFAVWKRVKGRWVRLGAELIASHTLRFAHRFGPTPGEYGFIDDAAFVQGATYRIEAVDARGRSSFYGPVTTGAKSLASDKRALFRPTPTLRELGADSFPRTLRRERTSVKAPRPLLAISPQALNVAVYTTGIHVLRGAALMAQGVPPGTPLGALALSHRGEGVPMQIEDDGVGGLSSNDRLYFWIDHAPTVFSRSTVLNLSWGFGGPRVGRLSSPAPKDAPPPGWGLGVWNHAPKTIYLAALNNGPQDNFVGPLIGPQGAAVPMELPGLVPGSEISVRFELQGVSLVPHEVELMTGDQVAAATRFSGRDLAVLEASVPADAKLSLRTLGGIADLVALASVRVHYPRALLAQVGGTELWLDGGQVVALSELGTKTRLWMLGKGEVTDLTLEPAWPVRIPGRGAARLVLWDRPVEVEPEISGAAPYSAEGELDLLVVAPAEFHEALSEHVSLRRAQGLKVSVTTPEALYDAYTYGQKNPEAIRAGVREAFAARGRGYVLLVGDGTFDPHDHLGRAMPDFIPVPTRNSQGLETAFDGFYADWDVDGRPNVALGRLPVKDVAQLTTVLEKLRRFEAATEDAFGVGSLVLTGEDGEIDVGSLGMKFESWQNVRVSLGGDPVEAHANLLSALLRPARMVNYFGHGSVAVWGKQGLFTSKEAATFAREAGPPSVFALMTCLNGFFHDVFSQSMAEALVVAERGPAVAVWASSGMTDPVVQQRLSGALSRALERQVASRLGDAILEARTEVEDSDTAQSFTLLGDPSLLLPWVPAEVRAPAPQPSKGELADDVEADPEAPAPASPALPPSTPPALSSPPEPQAPGCAISRSTAGSGGWPFLILPWLVRRRRPGGAA